MYKKYVTDRDMLRHRDAVGMLLQLEQKDFVTEQSVTINGLHLTLNPPKKKFLKSQSSAQYYQNKQKNPPKYYL
jgi:uncharacterized coiled-coil protein SlyX